jgi:hypothetical protein
VKQVIGMSNAIPWSKVWKSGSCVSAPAAISRGQSQIPTPKGGLILHWIFSVVLISATAGMGHISEAIGFPGNLQAYASGWVGSKSEKLQSLKYTLMYSQQSLLALDSLSCFLKSSSFS